MTFFNKLRVTTGKETPESSRLEFLEKLLVNQMQKTAPPGRSIEDAE